MATDDALRVLGPRCAPGLRGALRRCEVLPVAGATGPTPALDVRGLGERARMLRLQLDDGRVFDLAARDDQTTLAIGPFVAASMM